MDQESSRAFAASPTSVEEARRFVRLHSAGWPVSEDDLVLVTSELATNALCHGGGGFELTLSRHEEEVTIEIRDRMVAVPVVQQVDALTPSGRGLVIIGTLARSWGVRELPGDGKAVWARLVGADGSSN